MNLGNRIAQRHQAMPKTAGVVSSDYWDFTPGQRVMTREGFPGVVTAVSDGPYPGAEEYEVTLDADLGGGAYAPGELAPLDPPEASLEATAATADDEENWEFPYAEASVQADVHTAQDDYPELGNILEERPNHEHAIPVNQSRKLIASLNAEGQQVESGWGFDHLVAPTVNRMYENLPAQFQTVEHGYVSSYDWCRFRRASHCWYSYQIDEAMTEKLGRVVWMPQDRGMCPRASWDLQKTCPIAEPGPHSKDPNAKPDATLPYDAGGQRLSSVAAYVDAQGNEYDIQRRFELAKELGLVEEPFDWGDRKTQWKLWDNTDKVLYERWQKGDPEVHIWTGDGKAPWLAAAANLIAEAELQADPEWRFHFTASWADVRTKAKRIRSEGGVRIISAPRDGDTTISAEVRGEHNIYETTIMHEPGKRSVASWSCGCAWSSYSWGRSGRWKRYEGRMCSHALALTFEAQSRGMFGRTINEDRMKPPWRMDPTIPVVQPQNYPKPKKRRRASVEAPLARLRSVETHKDLEVAPAVLMAHAALSEGADPNDVMAALIELGCADAPGLVATALGIRSVPVKFKGIVHRLLEIADGKGRLEGVQEPVPLKQITYPTYDPTLGLNLHDNVPHLAQGADTKGVMICLQPPEKLRKTLADLGTENADNIHVTLTYHGKPDEVDRDALHDAVDEFAQKAPTLMAEVSGLGTFENGPENVLLATWDIPGIDQFRVALLESLRLNGITPYNNHGFTPHATLAYGDKPFTKLPKLPDEAKERFTFGEIVLSIGDDWKTFPLQPLGAVISDLQVEAMSAVEVAEQLRGEAMARRGLVEAAVEHAAAISGGRPVTRTQFNVKGVSRMSEKIAEYARRAGISVGIAQKAIKDALRFTIEWPTDDYRVGVGKAMDYLQSHGFRTDAFKNYWLQGDPYQGINLVMSTSDGFPWELQFHTPESLEVKEANHLRLEVVQNRNGTHNKAERKKAWNEMVQSTYSIPVPSGVIPMGQYRYDVFAARLAAKEYRYFLVHAANPDVPTLLYRMDPAAVTWEYLGSGAEWVTDNGLARHQIVGGTNHDEISADQADEFLQHGHVAAAGEWHNSDGFSHAPAEEMAQHLIADHPNEPDQRDHLPTDADELDQEHAEDHDMHGECGAHEAELHDEPEPALPETDGGEDGDDDGGPGGQAVGPGHPRLAWLVAGNGSGTSTDNVEIAAGAREALERLATKTFTPAEQRQIIDEGEGVTAANLDALDLTGTHYEALEAALAEEEDDEAWLA